MKTKMLCLCCLTMLLAINTCHADIAYDESTDGDLAVPSTPTILGALDLGANTIRGQLSNLGGTDPDAFSFDVASGQQLDSLAFTSMDGTNHFFAFNDGPLSEFSGSGILISTLVSNTDVGTNILDGTLNSFGGSGLSGGPLAAGNYNVWFQRKPQPVLTSTTRWC